METLGPNPEATFNNLRNKILETCHIKSEDPNTISTIEAVQKKRLDQELKLILGLDTPESPTVAAIGFFARAWISLCTLGRVMLSSFPDIGTYVTELQNNGIGIFKSYGIAMHRFLSQFSSREAKREVANALGV